MIDHISLAVKNISQSVFFYKKALEPLGIEVILSDFSWAGFGSNKRLYLFIREESQVPSVLHVAFVAKSRQAVDQFYLEALQAGGADNGAPGVRANYHPHYYAAYVVDPNGYNIEAVCHQPPNP